MKGVLCRDRKLRGILTIFFILSVLVYELFKNCWVLIKIEKYKKYYTVTQLFANTEEYLKVIS